LLESMKAGKKRRTDGDGAEAKSKPQDVDHVKGRRMSFAEVLAESPQGEESTQLVLNNRGISDVDPLSRLKELKKLELRGNQLSRLRFLEANSALCWLALAGNRFTKLDHLQKLQSLAVLDISDNKISSFVGLAGLQSLKALIATRNLVRNVTGITPESHPLLETLVLSHNQIEDFSFKGFPALKKISLSHNALKSFPELSELPELAELRLNGNKIASVGACAAGLNKLAILDIGSNDIASIDDLAVLKRLPTLKNLSLFGNACAPDRDAPPKALLEFVKDLPKLEVLNNKRQDGQSGKKKVKQEKAEARRNAAVAAKDTEGEAVEGRDDKRKDRRNERAGAPADTASRPPGDEERPSKKKRARPADSSAAANALEMSPSAPPSKKRKVKRGQKAAMSQASALVGVPPAPEAANKKRAKKIKKGSAEAAVSAVAAGAVVESVRKPKKVKRGKAQAVAPSEEPRKKVKRRRAIG